MFSIDKLKSTNLIFFNQFIYCRAFELIAHFYITYNIINWWKNIELIDFNWSIENMSLIVKQKTRSMIIQMTLMTK